MKKIIVLAALVFAAPALAQVVVAREPTEWGVMAQPGAASAPVAAKAAAPGVRHVARSITVCISAVAAQPDIRFVLRDGPTTTGTIIWITRAAAVIGTSFCTTSPPMNLIGTVNTVMTLESSAAPAATNFATVSLTGYSIGSDGRTILPN